MAKRVDPLLSVTGNFGRYGGAHNVRATAIGSTSRGPHHTLYFRGVIRATEDAKQDLREKSDQKSEVTRRMNHGAEAYVDKLGRTVLPRHPNTRRAPLVLLEAHGTQTDAGNHYRNQGGVMPARGVLPPPPNMPENNIVRKNQGIPETEPPRRGADPVPGPMQETAIAQKNRGLNKAPPPPAPPPARRRLPKLERDDAPRPPADPPDMGELFSPADAPAGPDLADLFGPDDDDGGERPLRDGTGVYATSPPSVATTVANTPAPGSVPGATASDEEVEAFGMDADEVLAAEEQAASSSAAPAAPAAPAEPAADPEVEKMRRRLPQMDTADIKQLQKDLRQADETSEGVKFRGKIITPAQRKQFMDMAKEELGKR